MTTTTNRVPAGVPTGGQFAPSASPESSVDLGWQRNADHGRLEPVDQQAHPAAPAGFSEWARHDGERVAAYAAELRAEYRGRYPGVAALHAEETDRGLVVVGAVDANGDDVAGVAGDEDLDIGLNELTATPNEAAVEQVLPYDGELGVRVFSLR